MIEEERKKINAGFLMFAPYGRIVIQQVMVIIGAILLVKFQTLQVFLVLLVIMKILLDMRSHFRERKKYLNKEIPQADDY